MPEAFRSRHRARFSEVDAAGIVFFGRYFTMAHDAFEELIREMGFSWDHWFRNPAWIAPLRHVEAEYLSPLRGGEEVEIEVAISHLGDSSFESRFLFVTGGRKLAELRHVHVFADPARGTKIPIPAPERACLARYFVSGATS